MCSRSVGLGHGCFGGFVSLNKQHGYWAWMFPDKMPLLFSGPTHPLVCAEDQVLRNVFEETPGPALRYSVALHVCWRAGVLSRQPSSWGSCFSWEDVDAVLPCGRPSKRTALQAKQNRAVFQELSREIISPLPPQYLSNSVERMLMENCLKAKMTYRFYLACQLLMIVQDCQATQRGLWRTLWGSAGENTLLH